MPLDSHRGSEFSGSYVHWAYEQELLRKRVSLRSKADLEKKPETLKELSDIIYGSEDSVLEQLKARVFVRVKIEGEDKPIILNMPEGATLADIVCSRGVNAQNRPYGIKVNGLKRGLDREVSNADLIEIKFSGKKKKPAMPSSSKAKTLRARLFIKNPIGERMNEAIKEGKVKFDKVMKKSPFAGEIRGRRYIDEDLKRIGHDVYGLRNEDLPDELFAAIGSDLIEEGEIKEIVSVLYELTKRRRRPGESANYQKEELLRRLRQKQSEEGGSVDAEGLPQAVEVTLQPTDAAKQLLAILQAA